MTQSAMNIEGSHRTPSYEHATAGDAMRAGVISCPAETPLRQVAKVMASEHIHCVVVMRDGDLGVVSDRDLIRATEGDFDAMTAGDIAVTDMPTVTTDEPLHRAAQLMVEHEVSHVLVVESGSGHAAGVLSTLDVAGILAWGRA